MLKSDSDTSGTSRGALWALFSAPAVGPGPCRRPMDRTRTLVGAQGRGSLLPARPQPRYHCRTFVCEGLKAGEVASGSCPCLGFGGHSWSEVSRGAHKQLRAQTLSPRHLHSHTQENTAAGYTCMHQCGKSKSPSLLFA